MAKAKNLDTKQLEIAYMGHLMCEADKHFPPVHNLRHYGLLKTTTILSGGLLAVLVIFSGVFYLGFHGSFAKVEVGSIQIHETDSKAHISDKVKFGTKNYKLPVSYPDSKKVSYALQDTGVSIDPEGSAKSIKQTLGRSFLQRLEWWKPIHLPLNTKVDATKFQAFINSKTSQVVSPAKDASLGIIGASVVVTPEVVGQGMAIISAKRSVPLAISFMSSTPLKLSPTKFKPAIYTKDLDSSKAKIEALVNSPVSFNLDGRTIKAEPSNVASWLELSADAKSKTVEATVDSGRVLDYINDVTGNYVHLPRNRVIATTDQGEVVIDPGINGMDVVGKNQIAIKVADQLMKNKSSSTNLDVRYTEAQTTQVTAYDKWIIADVTNKRMYAYEGTNLIHTFLISSGAPATPTVLGQYKIYAKYVSQDMKGANADGSGYFQPNVPYISYFYRDYAIHGNYWRPASWFGNINSSHGCLGVSPSDAEWIYNWAPIGTAVITHS